MYKFDMTFIFQIGQTLVGVGEKESTQYMFFAQQLSDDKNESPVGEMLIGGNTDELASKADKRIRDMGKDQEDIVYELRQFEKRQGGVQLKEIGRQDFVLFQDELHRLFSSNNPS